MISRTWIRLSIALVWLYQGLWCKVLGRSVEEVSVTSAAPFIGPAYSHAFLLALGLFEFGLGVWVLSGRWMRQAAIVQTVLLVAMNTAGLLWAWRDIHDPPGLILMNFVLVMLIWVATEDTLHGVSE